jgi:mRNA interferase MazF
MLCCPMTSQIKGYPFEVRIDGDEASVVLADQVKSLDWRQRKAVFKDKINASRMADVRRKVIALVGRP